MALWQESFLGIILFPGVHVYAQQTDCKVTMPKLSGTYTGGCKKGLAQGKGIAQGVDRYEGQFYKECLMAKVFIAGRRIGL